jgi:hypothetical protein
MPLYIHTCLSEVSGIAMMINCLISVVFGLWGNKDGTNTSDEELAQVPWMFKYFRSIVLAVSIGYNAARFVFECTRGDVMLITVLFRAVLDGLQLAEHLYLCQNYERLYVKQEGADFFWTRGLMSLSVFCGLGIFSGLEGVNGYGKAMLEHILWSLALFLLIAGGLVWGRWQTGGITRAKVSDYITQHPDRPRALPHTVCRRVQYVASRGAFGLCFLATFLLIVADSKAQGVTNRIAIAALFLIATGLCQYFHRYVHMPCHFLSPPSSLRPICPALPQPRREGPARDRGDRDAHVPAR